MAVAEQNTSSKYNYFRALQFKEGKEQVIGFFVGQVMKASQGKANPGQVNKMLKEKLSK